MSTEMDKGIKRWVGRRKRISYIEISQGKTTIADACGSLKCRTTSLRHHWGNGFIKSVPTFKNEKIIVDSTPMDKPIAHPKENRLIEIAAILQLKQRRRPAPLWGKPTPSKRSNLRNGLEASHMLYNSIA